MTLVATALACGSSARDEATGAARSAIQGGTSTTSYPWVMGLDVGGGTCTGALIAPNLVLTARHCVDATNTRFVSCSQTTFTTQTPSSQIRATTCANTHSCSRWYGAAKVLRTPGTKMCGADMALIILSSNVPASEATPIAPAVQYPIHDARYGHNVTAIGYGVTGPRANDSGIRRIVSGVSIVCIPGHRQSQRDCDGSVPAGMIEASEFITGAGACQGDSGSSAIEQNSLTGAPLSLGVLSRGGEDPDTGLCAESIWTRTDSMRDFIVAGVTEAAQRGGYALPAWTEPAPPPPDAGAPPPAKPDAGTPKPPAPPPPSGRGLGEACEYDDDCADGVCADQGAGFVCAAGCSESAPCGAGLTCDNGACRAAPPTILPPQATATAQASCSASEPGKPIPWAAALFGAWLLGAARLRRRRA